ncbi:hypothetical protein JZ751_016200 [Albula glossodonta]|uniref:Uncharacterized protein n=1 Tax=Albula glossodonta TaxID=121402 RepID=A0A8T2MTZ5_9TELE|nr:hypothetical protein JZ751_004704 [Albula glossodonta]KAG9332067.1 hypothetical protein JZ751_016200 [Albula glossodonta]
MWLCKGRRLSQSFIITNIPPIIQRSVSRIMPSMGTEIPTGITGPAPTLPMCPTPGGGWTC